MLITGETTCRERRIGELSVLCAQFSVNLKHTKKKTFINLKNKVKNYVKSTHKWGLLWQRIENTTLNTNHCVDLHPHHNCILIPSILKKQPSCGKDSIQWCLWNFFENNEIPTNRGATLILIKLHNRYT